MSTTIAWAHHADETPCTDTGCVHTDHHGVGDAAHCRPAPLPWRIGTRPTARSMWPIRDANDRIVCYTPSAAIAKLLVERP